MSNESNSGANMYPGRQLIDTTESHDATGIMHSMIIEEDNSRRSRYEVGPLKHVGSGMMELRRCVMAKRKREMRSLAKKVLQSSCLQLR